MSNHSEVQLKFLADSMLGKLARWLRMAGFDADYRKGSDFSAFLRIAREEKRIVLTRDTKFLKIYSPPEFFFIEDDAVEKQFKAVVTKFSLAVKIDKLCRCLYCNVPVEAVSRENVYGKVPDYIYDNILHFTRCPACSRIYWEGTHVEKLRERILKITGSFNF